MLPLCSVTLDERTNILVQALEPRLVILAGVHVCSSAHVNSPDPETALSRLIEPMWEHLTGTSLDGKAWDLSESLGAEFVWQVGKKEKAHRQDNMCEVILVGANPGVLDKYLSKKVNNNIAACVCVYYRMWKFSEIFTKTANNYMQHCVIVLVLK